MTVCWRFLKNPLWNRKVFKAILAWPDRMDLWEQFEGLLLNAATPQEGKLQPWRCTRRTKGTWTRALRSVGRRCVLL